MCVGLFLRKWLLLHKRQVYIRITFNAIDDQAPKPTIRKVFVGGLSVDTHDSISNSPFTNVDDLREYFSQFGEIENASVMYHHDKRHSRGFGFVLFKSSSSVNTLMQSGPHIIRNKIVDVKKAYPKDELANQAESAELIQEPRLSKGSFNFNSPLSDLDPSPTSHDTGYLFFSSSH